MIQIIKVRLNSNAREPIMSFCGQEGEWVNDCTGGPLSRPSPHAVLRPSPAQPPRRPAAQQLQGRSRPLNAARL